MGKEKVIVQPEIESRFAVWRRGAAAMLAAAGGLTTLAAQVSAAPSALGSHRPPHGMELVPLHALGVAGGLGLLVLAHGLWRGKRSAADIGVGALCILALGRIALGQGALDGGIELGFALLL